MANKKKYHAQNSKAKEKQERNKSLALLLILSMAVLLSLYFGLIKAHVQIIQEIYIWSFFVLAIVYISAAVYIAFVKEKMNKGGISADTVSKRLCLLDRLRRGILLILVPIIFALLIDYMLILLGFAGYFGI